MPVEEQTTGKDERTRQRVLLYQSFMKRAIELLLDESAPSKDVTMARALVSCCEELRSSDDFGGVAHVDITGAVL